MFDLSTQQIEMILMRKLMLLWSLLLLASLEHLVQKIDYWIKNLFIVPSSLDIDIGEMINEILYLWNSIVSIIIYHQKNMKYTLKPHYNVSSVITLSLSVSLSLSKMPLKHHCMYLCFIDNSILFWKTRSNITNKRKQNK